MEYTHIHKYQRAKVKPVQQKKVKQIDPVNKGNKKLYLPVKNKTKVQIGKQN